MTQPESTPDRKALLQIDYDYLINRIAADKEKGIEPPEQFFASLGRTAYELHKLRGEEGE